VINISSYIDHTVLKPTTTHMDVKKICEEAMQYKFAAVCIPPSLVTVARRELAIAAPPLVATVIGFLAAATIAINTLRSPVGPVLSTLLVGIGGLAGLRSAHHRSDTDK